MTRFTYISHKVKATWKKFKLLLITYFVIVGIWIIIFFSQLECIDQSFLLNWLSSLTQDIFFFTTIGLLGLIITTRLPEEEEIEVRINSLANSLRVDKDAKIYLNKEVKKLLCYSSRTHFDIEFQHISKDEKYIFLHSTYESDIMNMCRDVDVMYPMHGMAASSKDHDGIESYVSQHYINNVVIDVKTRKKDNIYPLQKGKWINLKNCDDFKYEKDTDCIIQEDNIITQGITSGIWNELNGDRNINSDWYFITFSCFTYGITLNFDNNTGKDVYFSYRYIDRRSNEIDKIIYFRHNVVECQKPFKLVIDADFYKQDRIEFFFHTI